MDVSHLLCSLLYPLWVLSTYTILGTLPYVPSYIFPLSKILYPYSRQNLFPRGEFRCINRQVRK